MPFIVQCPHPDCRKYMLVEDSARGSMVDCLICKKSIQVSASSGDDNTPSPQPNRRPPQPAGGTSSPFEPPPIPQHKPQVRQCPQCQQPLRVPAAPGNPAIQCPHCKHIFK